MDPNNKQRITLSLLGGKKLFSISDVKNNKGKSLPTLPGLNQSQSTQRKTGVLLLDGVDPKEVKAKLEEDMRRQQLSEFGF